MENEQQQAGKVGHISIGVDDAGQRLDNFLFRCFRKVPKSRVYRALRHGEVRINKKRAKPDYRLQAGDQLRLPPLQVAEAEVRPVSQHWQVQLAEAILFENDDVLIINKPSGLAVHGGSGLDYGLIEVVRAMRPECRRLELAHRLDRDTSGCTIICKKASALRMIHQQLRDKTLKKTYLALVKGRWPRRKTLVDAPLDKNILQSGERMVKVSADGKPSLTRFDIAELFAGATLIRAMPVTGRTHQIRVHAQYAGFPLLGDSKYGNREDDQWLKSIGLERLFLHASELELDLPDIGRIHVVAPLPDDLQRVLARLRQQ